MKWALVLSGGGGSGISYIGFLKAIEEMGYPKPHLIVGCSIGAIIGGFYAVGMTPMLMEKFLLNNFDFKQYLTTMSLILPDNKLTKVIQFGEGLSNILNKQGVESGRKILEFFKIMTANKNIEHTEIPFVCNATELLSGKEHIFESENMAQALRASSSFPGIFEPMNIKDKLFVDGYVTHNTPVWIAKYKGFSNILAVYPEKFNVRKKQDIGNGIDVLLRCMDIAAVGKGICRMDIPTTSLVFKDTYGSHDFGHIKERIQKGYIITQETKEILDDFFNDTPIIGYFKRKKLAKLEHSN